MRLVRDAAGFLAVNLFFVAINVFGAAVMWALGTLTLRAWPDAADAWWVWLVIGAAGVATAVWFACAFMRFICRRPR